MKNDNAKKSLKDISLKPFSFVNYSMGTSGIFILLLLSVQVIMLLVTKSYRAFSVVLISTLASFLAETFYYHLKKNFHSSFVYAVVQGLLLGLLIPADYPLLAVFFVPFFCLLICKYAWDGFGHSWINPVALTVLVLYFLNVSFFEPFLLTSEDLQTRNAALVLIQNGTVPVIKVDSEITAFLNKTVFSLFGIVIPEGYISLFWDTGSNIAAFRFNFITLISSIILIAFEMVDYIIPLLFVVTYSILVRFLFPVFTSDMSIRGDILLALLTSGTLFSTLFLLQWWGTTPVTKAGKAVFGITAGVLAFLIIGFGTSSCGYIFVIVGMNIISPIIQYFENLSVNKKLNKILLPKVNALSEVENV